ncbi:MAG TPA: shikimate dehydrogenase [Solirubrobacteraceae bacterium]|nr:shikimate dehydrogenase [Solirubrobacteraceae bacterium]
MPRLGVLGWPVAHSRSPAMHNAALQALHMDDWRYQRLPVPPERFAETVRALAPAGFAGANVTIPHKRAALALAEEASDGASAIGAANTLSFGLGGSIAAENTDAPGFLAALEVSPRGMSALVLGAGGAARAVVWALREAGARDVSVWNRTPARAAALARELGVRAASRPQPADLLVNCTSVGLRSARDRLESRGEDLQRSANEAEELNLLGLTFDQVGEYPHVADLVYSSAPTALLAAARAHGARTVDGLQILLAQGALSFELWTGVSPPLDVMRRALRDSSQDGETGPGRVAGEQDRHG